MMKKLVVIIVAFLIVILYFLFPKPLSSEAEKAKEICIKKCQDALSSGQNLANGPCLLNPIEELPDWVCDVAHHPRENIDNLPENQCSAFREGKAKHFVEVSPTCEFIRSY
ncbi:MAG: hypothetical protein QXG91_00380 [Candidatus Aenigmatarchaeota archaeon]